MFTAKLLQAAALSDYRSYLSDLCLMFMHALFSNRILALKIRNNFCFHLRLREETDNFSRILAYRITFSFLVRLHDSIQDEGFHYLVFDL